jgi:hypothetical protein
MVTVGLILIAWGLITLVGSAVGVAQLRHARRRARRWSGSSHRCHWLPRGIWGWDEGATVVIEECARCPAMRLASREGTWLVNRFGELVNAGDFDVLQRML